MTDYAYGYSEEFNILKDVKETLGDNYTTRDYVGSLDLLLFNAVKSVVLTSSFSDTFMANVCAWYSSNAKRRISRLDKSEFFGLVAQMLATDDPAVKFEKVKLMQLERTILYFMVDSWLIALNGYTQCVSVCAKTKDKTKRLKMTEYEYTVGRRRNASLSLYSAIREAKFWLANFLQLKQLILEKYSRMIVCCAQKDYKSMGHKVSLSDLVQNYMVTAARALDKCDFKQGTLTSYIQLWLKSARSKSIRTDSIDSCPRSQNSDKSVVHIRLDDTEFKDESNSKEMSSFDTSSHDDQVTNIRVLIKLIDPTGVFRLITGIEEHLNAEEIRLLT